MRKQFVASMESLLEVDSKLVLLLGDIGVFGFRKAFQAHPERVFNIGILEQATVSLAAGLAKTGLVPVVHTIAPFLVERSFEQLKNDFGYQVLGGNFVSVGASYDYAALGCTHHCPGDVGALKNIPNMQIVLPGTPAEFDGLFGESYNNKSPTYFRLSERSNPKTFPVKFGKAHVVKTGSQATVIAVGPALRAVLGAVDNFDVTVLYYTSVSPFDLDSVKKYAKTSKILLCEPYYSGILAADICRALWPKPVLIDCVGVPHRFLTKYGRSEEHDLAIEFTSEHIETRLKRLIES